MQPARAGEEGGVVKNGEKIPAESEAQFKWFMTRDSRRGKAGGVFHEAFQPAGNLLIF